MMNQILQGWKNAGWNNCIKFEEVAKLPKTTDTCGATPDVLELVLQRILDYD